MPKKRLVVCDYENPNGYTFPNFDMGSSEKRIWHFAKAASELPNMEVIITGPLWLPQYVPNATHFPERLGLESVDKFIQLYGTCDYLFAGHEYFDKDKWVKSFERCARTLISYQLHPYHYSKESFNGVNKILFCYSDEMLRMYSNQRPIKAQLFHSGVDEEPQFFERPDPYILWFGRLDKEKAPHYAILASKKCGLPLKIMGRSVVDQGYIEELKANFDCSNVEFIGFLSGKAKMEVIGRASCILYTVSREFREAGAGVFGEALASGVPVAGITWVGDDAVCSAVSSDSLGKIIHVANMDEEDIPEALASAIKDSLILDRKIVHSLGSQRYDPRKLTQELLSKVDQITQ